MLDRVGNPEDWFSSVAAHMGCWRCDIHVGEHVGQVSGLWMGV